ncbi:MULTISPECIES: retropepsin-like aspartic protease family protein [Delftia]|uniref:Retropepsin-like aspartic protease n=3 Tax=Delftia TaxID=80865 RepID=A0AAX3SH90_9BURK|nr:MULTISPECIES: retropepsin-like aspartic protease [Delftia]KAA9178249.1 TIGR02281 family clan AA aspartic protease [Delftia sp. BR1]EPD46997.1 aspartyl protease [Delftia acidovorans CCUG 15835]MCO5339997.1 retroviral-like aspartic protease family protein [Delftia tsuruhatensis]MCR4547574.1 retroviral-like aspartic protease family protein [Delftia tsuruhatensis]MCX7504437.1 retropepsin-like aspartic protease [Delftia tsuruhatensis]
MRHLRAVLLSLAAAAALAPPSATAQSVALSGVLGSKALLVIDGGTPRALAAGESLQDVRVLQVSGDTAEVEIKGRRQTLRLGEAPISLGGRGAAAGDPALGRRVVLKADNRGHFIERGQINGKTMVYMVDTGASSVAIGRSDAERMGLPFLKGQPVMMRTANGDAQGWRLRLDSVRVGDVEVFGVDAVVAPLPMPYVLLGNSFLAHVQMTRQGSEMVLERR